MSSDWKESSIKRRDFRHQKTEDDQTLLHEKSKKGKKPFLIEYKYVGTGISFFGTGWISFSRYHKERDALEALKALRNSSTWQNYEFRLLNQAKEIIA